jgi:hypothetical protein
MNKAFYPLDICIVQITAEVYPRAKQVFQVGPKSHPDLTQLRCGLIHRNLDHSPPPATVFINDMVTLLYFLLYSIRHHFSSSNGSHKCRLYLSASSFSVSGERDKPSRIFEGHQFGCTCARWDRWTPSFLRDPGALVEVGLFCETTFAPKNFRISASLSRCGSETDNRDDRVCCRDVEALALGVEFDILCRSGYLCCGKCFSVKQGFHWTRQWSILDRELRKCFV